MEIKVKIIKCWNLKLKINKLTCKIVLKWWLFLVFKTFKVKKTNKNKIEALLIYKKHLIIQLFFPKDENKK